MMPTGKHEHIKEYNLNQLKEDILNDKLFGFIQVDIETPEQVTVYSPTGTTISITIQARREYGQEGGILVANNSGVVQ